MRYQVYDVFFSFLFLFFVSFISFFESCTLQSIPQYSGTYDEKQDESLAIDWEPECHEVEDLVRSINVEGVELSGEQQSIMEAQRMVKSQLYYEIYAKKQMRLSEIRFSFDEVCQQHLKVFAKAQRIMRENRRRART
mmetsp:Transcript_8456/g.14195  ORF Transcript_8456/g.14195 Transcript_8456/m.14195 type:complete len:137 (+) Transcript_8456:848-1258(+)